MASSTMQWLYWEVLDASHSMTAASCSDHYKKRRYFCQLAWVNEVWKRIRARRMAHCQAERGLLLLREYLAADADLRGWRPACYSISLHLKLIAKGPSLLWKYVWTGKVHWHAAHSQDHISRNKKAHWLRHSYKK